MADASNDSWGKSLWNWGTNILGGAIGWAAENANDTVAGEVGAKVLAKGALLKFTIKKIPFVGALAGLYYGGQAAWRGDWQGAIAEVASGALSTLGPLGILASAGVDAAIAYRQGQRMFNQSNPWNKVPVLNMLPEGNVDPKAGVLTIGDNKTPSPPSPPAPAPPPTTTPAPAPPPTPATPQPATTANEEYVTKFAFLATKKGSDRELVETMKVIARRMPADALQAYIEGLSGYDNNGKKNSNLNYEDSLAHERGLLSGTPTPQQRKAINEVRNSIPQNLTKYFKEVQNANGKAETKQNKASDAKPSAAKPERRRAAPKSEGGANRRRRQHSRSAALRAETSEHPLQNASGETYPLKVGQCSPPGSNGKFVCLEAGGRPTLHQDTPKPTDLRSATAPPLAPVTATTTETSKNQTPAAQAGVVMGGTFGKPWAEHAHNDM